MIMIILFWKVIIRIIYFFYLEVNNGNIDDLFELRLFVYIFIFKKIV